jgi:hypothetical protein
LISLTYNHKLRRAEEIEDEVKWNQAFTHSQDALAKLAAAALKEYRSGKTQELDPEAL